MKYLVLLAIFISFIPSLTNAAASSTATRASLQKQNNVQKIKFKGARKESSSSSSISTEIKPVFDPKATNALANALKENNLEKIYKIINAGGANLNAPIWKSFTPLHFAVETNNLELLKLLLSRGADPLLTSGEADITPLHRAIYKGLTRIIYELIEFNPDILEKSNFIGNMAIHTAICRADLATTRILIDSGSPLNIKDGSNQTPLECAYSEKEKRAEEENNPAAKVYFKRSESLTKELSNLDEIIEDLKTERRGRKARVEKIQATVTQFPIEISRLVQRLEY